MVRLDINLTNASFTINSIGDVELGIMATNQAKNNLEQFFRTF